MHRLIYLHTSWILLLILAGSFQLNAQDRFRVERIRTVPDNLPILNIHVDEENVKWVANSRTLYKVEAKDIATEVPLGGQVSLLQFPGGNADIRWSTDAMQSQLGNAQITAAAFDQSQKVLWIGTNGYGVFKFKVNPDLRLMEQLHIDNSKLRSDFINSIYISKAKVWIASGDGAVAVEGNNWTHHQKFFNIQRIRGRGNELWAIGDDLIWIIDRRDNWTPIAINRREIEGEINDIALDPEGRVWIASNIMTSYRIEHDRYQRFGPGQYFTSQFVNFVSVDDDATIWVGTDDKGLYIIEKESTITVTHTIDKYLNCNGAAQDAALSVRAIGGKPPYTFAWEHGANGDQISGLGPGTYKLTVTDTEGSSKAEVIEVPDPFMTLSAVMDKPESGPGKEDGAATVSVKGGVPPYSYEWYSGIGEASMTGLPEGEYGITVTDAAGCSEIITVAVTQILQPLSVSIEQKAFNNCPGEASAVLAVQHAGGKMPLTWRWSDGGPAQEFREGLEAGTYSVTATDAVGNTATAAISISEPMAMSAVIKIDKPALANADNGAATVQMTGGNPPFQYNWDNGEVTQSATRLSARRHTLTVTDASGCTTVAAVDISENILPLAVQINKSGEMRCSGDASVSLEVQVDGGKSPFTYTWNNSALSGASASSLGAGQYSVTVSDAAGNAKSASVSIAQPDLLNVNIKVDKPAQANQQNGAATIQVTGGTSPYQFLWDNGETNKSATRLSPDAHAVTVTDAAGCTHVANVNISENILPLNASVEQSGEVRCPGDAGVSLSVHVEGGKSPFSYRWNRTSLSGDRVTGLGTGDYSVTVSDAAGNSAVISKTITGPAPIQAITTAETPSVTGKNEGHAVVRAEGGTGRLSYRWDNGDEGPKTQSLSAGVHYVTVTDANGCTTVAEVTIVEDFLPLTLRLEQTQEILCAGQATGSVAATVSGGNAPYAYLWSNGTTGTGPLHTLGSGTYSLVVTDANGTSVSQEVTIREPAMLQVKTEVLASASANQSDGKARVVVNGGTSPFAYVWSHGSSEAQLQSLAAGNYQVTVTDANGCSATSVVQITEDILPLQVSIHVTAPVRCAGNAEAAVEAIVSGGKSPFVFTWNDQATGPQRSGLQAGMYTVTVSDAAGQQTSSQVSVEQPQQLAGEIIEVRAATHERIEDGKATARVMGGLTPYTFIWDNAETTARAVSLAVGRHTVTVTDANGCAIQLNTEISEKILPELTASNLERGEAVRMEKLLFAADSSSIDESSLPTLEELYQFLYDNPTIVVEIGGHTNGLPEHDYCDKLSTERAKAVADYIIDKGVDPKRILFKGYGKRQPIATNMTPEGRKRNQRVEVKIVKLSE